MSGQTGGGGPGAPVRQGFLRKLKTMKKKYFVLRAGAKDNDARLEYYESEKKCRAGAAPRRVLPLNICYNIVRRLDLKHKHVIALFTSEEQFCVVAENEHELQDWLSQLHKLHKRDNTVSNEDRLHPIQHVWQVNVQKKGLGAVKNIHGLYNLCLNDKTLSLVKIKSHNNVISELGIPERIEYSLKNIRRCGDSECFFYMEVGRQTTTGAGELWMHSEDSNIAQSMHSTILLAMRNCAKDSENERDHIVIPKSESGLRPRCASFADGRSGRASLASDAGTLRNRCDSMPSRAVSSFEIERPTPRHNDLEGADVSRDETDAVSEWLRTPRIPEEPDICDINKEINSMSVRGGPYQHSRTSSLGVEDADNCPPPAQDRADGYLAMVPLERTDGYLPMVLNERTDGYLPMEPIGGLVSASSGSVCSGTPSTDPRFSEYQLEPATMHICESRPPRAYSVGSRPAPREQARHRAYSVGAHARPAPPAPAPARTAHDDLMLLDFTPTTKSTPSATPVATPTPTPASRAVDDYVDMSPNTGYMKMQPGAVALPAATPPAAAPPATPAAHGYLEMNYGKGSKPAGQSRPIAIAAARAPPPPAAASPDDRFRRLVEARPSHGSQIFEFSSSLESPASPPAPAPPADEPRHLATVREAAEDRPDLRNREFPPLPDAAVSCSPQYVTLKTGEPAPPPLPPHPPARQLSSSSDTKGEPCGAPVVVASAGWGGAAGARFAVGGAPAAAPPSPSFTCAPLNYAALDLEPRRAAQAAQSLTYTKIDFIRSEKLAADGT